MRRTLSNRPVLVIAGLFVIAIALLLRTDPFGKGTIVWPGAIAIALIGTVFVVLVIVPWAAPFLASTGGKAGAAAADPRTIARSERWLTAILLTFALVGLLAIDFASRDLIISPTQRLERNAILVRENVKAHAPEEFQLLLTAADTWRMSDRTYRSCIPSSKDESKFWCVLVQGKNTLKVVDYGPGKSNAAQFLEWHPDGKRVAD